MKHLIGLALLGLAASQPPTPTVTPVEAADALAWAVLPWACGLEVLAVLLGLYLVLMRPVPADGPDDTEAQTRPGA
jgi:hypothetical protein